MNLEKLQLALTKTREASYELAEILDEPLTDQERAAAQQLWENLRDTAKNIKALGMSIANN